MRQPSYHADAADLGIDPDPGEIPVRRYVDVIAAAIRLWVTTLPITAETVLLGLQAEDTTHEPA